MNYLKWYRKSINKGDRTVEKEHQGKFPGSETY